MDRFEDMQIFISVAQTRSLSAAAKATGTPLSSVSRRVAGLEGRLGVTLLHRTSRKVELTEHGRVYLERARAIVDAVSAAEDELRAGAERPRGRLRVSMPPDYCQIFLTPVFVEYAGRFPDVAFEFDLSPRLVDLVGEGFDVAIRVGTLSDSSLATRTISRIRAAMFASPAYLEARGVPASPADLARHDCLELRGERRPRDWTLQGGGGVVHVRATGRASANNPSMLRLLARAGMGIALFDELLAVDDLESGALVRVLPEWRAPPTPVHAVTPTKNVPKKSRLLIECLRSHLQQVRARLEKADGATGKK